MIRWRGRSCEVVTVVLVVKVGIVTGLLEVGSRSGTDEDILTEEGEVCGLSCSSWTRFSSGLIAVGWKVSQERGCTRT